MDNKDLLRAAIADMTFLKVHEKTLLDNAVNSMEELARLESDDIAHIVKRNFTTTLWHKNFIEKRSIEIVHLMAMYQIKAVHIGDSEYPAPLKEIYDPPFMLFYRGNIDALDAPCVSIVGTRDPVRYAAQATFEFAKDASQKGYTVVSGLALGIDSFAHRGALSASAGTATCAVLASGVDEISPASNKALARVILSKDGCVMSEYAPGTPPLKWQFPARNRIISGLSSATLIADAPENSGALITADFALEQGRDVFFHRAALIRFQNVEDSQSAGSGKKVLRDARAYIQSGAPVVDSFEDFLGQQALCGVANRACASVVRGGQETLF
jgi:DNA processing protein